MLPHKGYPSLAPMRAISCGRFGLAGEARFWPGGWVVAPAWPYAVGGTVSDALADSAWAQKGVIHDQSAANYAAAAVTCSLRPVDDLGLREDVPYQLQVGFRVSSAGTNIGVRTGPKPVAGDPRGAGGGTDAGFPSYVFGTGVVHAYFGIFGLAYDNGISSGGDGRFYSRGEVLDIKAYRTAGTGAVVIDQLYFIPVGMQPGAPGAANDLISASEYIGQASSLGPTATYVLAPGDSYADGGGASRKYVRDTQNRYGWVRAGTTATPVDDRPTWSTWSNAAQLYPFGGHSEQEDWQNWHPRHLYVLAHGRWPTEHVFEQFKASGFVTVGADTMPTAQAPVISDSWAWHYLGLWSRGRVSDVQLALWRAAPWVAGVPWSNTDGAITDVEIESMIASSSLYDWCDYRKGGSLWLPGGCGDPVLLAPTPVPAGVQPSFPDADPLGISVAFDSDTFAQPAWTRLDA